MQKHLDGQVSRTTQEALTDNSFLIVERMPLYKFIVVNWDYRSSQAYEIPSGKQASELTQTQDSILILLSVFYSQLQYCSPLVTQDDVICWEIMKTQYKITEHKRRSQKTRALHPVLSHNILGTAMAHLNRWSLHSSSVAFQRFFRKF